MSLRSQVEVLVAIYSDEVTVVDNVETTIIEAQLPFKDSQISDKHHVSAMLTVTLANHDDDSIAPIATLTRVRGLDEKSTLELEKKLKQLIKDEENAESLVYDLFAAASEYLASHDSPTLPCPICLSPFSSEDEFVNLPCDHAFHNVCIGEYISVALEELEIEEKLLPAVDRESFRRGHPVVCPSCRDPLSRQILSRSSLLRASKPPDDSSSQDAADPQSKIQPFTLNGELKEIYERQKCRGGLIGFEPDPEWELNRNREETAAPELNPSSSSNRPVSQIDEAAGTARQSDLSRVQSSNDRAHYGRADVPRSRGYPEFRGHSEVKRQGHSGPGALRSFLGNAVSGGHGGQSFGAKPGCTYYHARGATHGQRGGRSRYAYGYWRGSHHTGPSRGQRSKAGRGHVDRSDRLEGSNFDGGPVNRDIADGRRDFADRPEYFSDRRRAEGGDVSGGPGVDCQTGRNLRYQNARVPPGDDNLSGECKKLIDESVPVTTDNFFARNSNDGFARRRNLNGDNCGPGPSLSGRGFAANRRMRGHAQDGFKTRES